MMMLTRTMKTTKMIVRLRLVVERLKWLSTTTSVQTHVFCRHALLSRAVNTFFHFSSSFLQLPDVEDNDDDDEDNDDEDDDDNVDEDNDDDEDGGEAEADVEHLK